MGTLDGMTLTHLLRAIGDTLPNSPNYDKLEKEVLRRFKVLHQDIEIAVAERDNLRKQLVEKQKERDDYREAWVTLERQRGKLERPLIGKAPDFGLPAKQHLQICGLLRDKIMLQAKLRRLRKRFVNRS